jgi:hypothetical protein
MTGTICIICGKEAFAFLLKEDGSKTYHCLHHFPLAEPSPQAEKSQPKDRSYTPPRPV